MAVTLNANTSTGFIATSDTSGVLQLQTGGTTALTIGTDQSVNFPVTAQRITGDFSNATLANRVMFQTSTVNGVTRLGAIPNGTATQVNLTAYNSSDPNNASLAEVICLASEMRIQSNLAGTGSFLPMTFHTGGSESLRLSATTKAVILAGGSTSANGTGIAFPATQSASSDANTLDDYEEGTWSPGIAFGGNAVGVTYTSNRYGRYTKIGERVIATCYFALSSKGSSTGGVSFTGLPFASNSTANGGFAPAALWMSGISVTNGVVTAYTNANATTFDVNYTVTNGNAGGANALTDGFVSGTASVMISVSYLTS